MADISRYRGGARVKRGKPAGGKQVVSEGAGSRQARERRESLRSIPVTEEPVSSGVELIMDETGTSMVPRISLPYERARAEERRLQEEEAERDKDGLRITSRGVGFRQRF